MKKLTFLFGAIYIVVLLILVRSFVLSGYRFQFNGDEVFNANIVYLLLKGYKPYTDFYLGYSPIFHWFLSPVFLLFGFSFKAVSMARILMIVIFFLKVFLLFFLIRKVFGKMVAYLFLPLFLLNPFAVFAEMQIRPDNLMMFFYTLFLLVFYYAHSSRRPLLFIFSGALFGLTFLTHMKVTPSLLAFGLVFFVYSVGNRYPSTRTSFGTGHSAYSLQKLLYFLNGFAISGLVFLLVFLLKGNLLEMVTQVFIDSFQIYNRYPTWLGYFYFSNPVVYGHEGKPMAWIYAWSLPIMAFAGGYASLFLYNKVRHVVKNNDGVNLIKIILFVSLVFQWTSLLFINSVFMQYYIPINWLYALFSAYLIYSLINQIKDLRLLKIALTACFLIFFILLLKSSVKGNLARSKITDDPIPREMSEFWRIVPEDSPAYPNVIFRKPIYPMLWGQVISDRVRDRYPPAYMAIEKHKLKTLTGLTDDFMSYLDSGTQTYIQSHYTRDPSDSRIWRRKD